MRLILVALGLALAACHKQQPVPQHKQGYVQLTPVHPFAEAASVRLFIENGIDKKGHSTFESKTGRLLSPEQRRAYESLLTIQTPVNLSEDDPFFMVAGCFIPHHFFRYFDKAGRQIGEVAVCFCCSGVAFTDGNAPKLKDDQRLSIDYTKLKALLNSWGAPTNVMCGPDEG